MVAGNTRQGTRFVGRARESQLIEARAAAAFDGRGALFLIHGEAGIGKSELAYRVGERGRASGAAFAVGKCDPRGASPPYAPWLELLADLMSTGEAGYAALPQQLGGERPAETAFEIARAVSHFIDTAAQSQPLILLFDDLHWADQESLDLLERVTRRLDRLAALILVTYRDGDAASLSVRGLAETTSLLAHDRPAWDMRLGPLNRTETGELIATLGVHAADELVDLLQQRSSGIPLYVRELLTDLVERERLEPAGQGSRLLPGTTNVVPARLAQIFARRIAALHPDVGELLSIAAVNGERWELPVIERVLDWPEGRLLAALEAAVDAQLIAGTDASQEGYRFCHGLIREALYGRLVARRRKGMHARIAAALDAVDSDDVALMAYHCAAAGETAKTVQYSLAAADSALVRFAANAACELYAQADKALARDPEAVVASVRTAVHAQAGDAHMTLNHKADAFAAFSRMLAAAEASGDRLAQCRALCRRSHIERWRDNFAESRRDAEAAMRVANGLGSAHALVAAQLNRAHLHIVGGMPADASTDLEVVERLARKHDLQRELGRGLQLQAYVALFCADYESAQRCAMEARELARINRDFLALSGASFSIAFALGERGRYTQARAVLREGLDTAEESGELHYFAKLQNSMGWLCHQVGDYEAAVRWNLEALESSRRRALGGIVEAECYSLLNLASDEIRRRRLPEAERRLQELDQLLETARYSRTRYYNRSLIVRAELDLANEEFEAAAARAREAAHYARRHGYTKNLTRAQLLEGCATIATAPERAAEMLDAAVTRADDMSHAALSWHTRLALAEAAAASGVDATRIVAEAVRRLDAILLALDDHRWRESLDTTDEARRLRAAATRTADGCIPIPAGLTPREVQVLGLIARGDTNQMIAFELNITTKTVDAHTQSILRKTGSGNRTAAAAFAITHHLASCR